MGRLFEMHTDEGKISIRLATLKVGETSRTIAAAYLPQGYRGNRSFLPISEIGSTELEALTRLTAQGLLQGHEAALLALLEQA